MHKTLDIIYEDSDLLVVNKPGGLLSVPGRLPGNQDCIASRVRASFPEAPSHPAVHRLDMATSGLMVLAINSETQRTLAIQFQDRQVEKIYEALLNGTVQENYGEIKLSFRLDPDNRPHQICDPVNGKIGITKWQKLAVEDGRTRIRFFPMTGRTHQLRVHSAHELGLNAPIIGDSLYGSGNFGDKMYLHAAGLSFKHPVSGEKLKFEAPVPF